MTEPWDAIWRDATRPQRVWPSEDVVRFAARRLRPGARVVEAGCGNGANLWFLAAEGFDVTGADVSAEALNLLLDLFAARGLREPGLARCDLRELEAALAGETFDAVVDCRASQHLPWDAHADAYAQYSALLRPGGWLFLLHLTDGTTDARLYENRALRSGEHTWADISAGVYPGNGTVCMPPTWALTSALTRAGLHVERAETLRRLQVLGPGGAGVGLVAEHAAFDARKPGATGGV